MSELNAARRHAYKKKASAKIKRRPKKFGLPQMQLSIYFFLKAMTASPAIAATPSAIREAHRRDDKVLSVRGCKYVTP